MVSGPDQVQFTFCKGILQKNYKLLQNSRYSLISPIEFHVIDSIYKNINKIQTKVFLQKLINDNNFFSVTFHFNKNATPIVYFFEIK